MLVDDRITVIVGTELKQKVKLKCVNNKINITEYIINLIKSDLEK